MGTRSPIMVLGASGLIGAHLTHALVAEGFDVVPVARRFTPSQKQAFSRSAAVVELADFSQGALADLFADHKPMMVVNAVGALQNTPAQTTATAHEGVMDSLLGAMRKSDGMPFLVQISIPGNADEDETEFSQTKRNAELAIVESDVPHAILRPGFVVAPAAYGGSALVRALAMVPFKMPPEIAARPFAATNVDDISGTVAHLARLGPKQLQNMWVSWDVMESQPGVVGEVVDDFRTHFGQATGRISLPLPILRLGAFAGDVVAYLGWRPPVRSTALAEMQRGVSGYPQAWMEATGIQPKSLAAILAGGQASVQEKWFARLYLLKALIFSGLAIFWIVSGLIALFAAFDAATAILTVHGVPLVLGQAITVLTSLMDIGVGLLISWRKTSRIGLIAGIGASIFYMLGAAVLTPELWVEPLGALVKTGPAIVLMLVGLAVLEDR